MKKKLLILLFIVMSITLVGCGKTEKEDDSGNKNNQDGYVERSKKSAFIDISTSFVESARTKVNEGKELRFFNTDILYMIPVGTDSSKYCVTVEYSGESPYGDSWSYAYVGVVYNGKGYNYYFIGEASTGVGVPFLTLKDLYDSGTEYIYKSYASSLSEPTKDNKGITKNFSNYLNGIYGTKVKERELTDDEKIAFAAIKNVEKVPTKILYVDSNCKYE